MSHAAGAGRRGAPRHHRRPRRHPGGRRRRTGPRRVRLPQERTELTPRRSRAFLGLCRYVVVSGQPLIVPDARADDRLHTDPAIAALGVIAYAGMPLTDADELVLGSLCALAHKPRTWTDEEQGDLTAACSAELRLRILSAQRRSTQKGDRAGHRRAGPEQRGAPGARAQVGLDHA